MIQSLLKYQAKEKEKLILLDKLEAGAAKCEFDETTRIIENASSAVTTLDNDARSLIASYESVTKAMSDIFEIIEKFNKNQKDSTTEEEAGEALSYVSGLLSKVSSYESQLADINAKIVQKTTAFENAKKAAGEAQRKRQIAKAEYEKQQSTIKPQLETIEAELKTLSKDVDTALLEKYRAARQQNKSARSADVVVPLSGNRCGGCMFELALSGVHKIATDGCMVCEECAKIIYKN
jgi:predicted  nucleic acid-binding Zn-ribbon protein